MRSKVTSKLQVTLPKKLADKYGIRPGDEVRWVADGVGIRLIHGRDRHPLNTAERLLLFDKATRRIRSMSGKQTRKLKASDFSRRNP